MEHDNCSRVYKHLACIAMPVIMVVENEDWRLEVLEVGRYMSLKHWNFQ